MKTDTINTTNPLVGRRVLNVHRQDPEVYCRDLYYGTITGILPGCNALVQVLFDGRHYACWMVARDLAYCELWPGEDSRVVIPDELRQNP